ncbi:hypothetical protein LTR22_008615 [Elasticomyces elasticus]|nr:hypothetical protein LTR22_008615 [Elasticomyces elasticus]KAK4923170.1 hypothetical protein LTR49_009638 [Elasticomyces elasticus]
MSEYDEDVHSVLASRKLGGEHKKYLASLNWRRPLLTALRNISKVSAGQDITLVVGDDYSPYDLGFCGQRTAERQLDAWFRFRVPSSTTALWPGILQTLLQSHCQITALRIGSEYCPIALNELDDGLIYTDEDFYAVFGGMQRLQFYCKDVKVEKDTKPLPHSQCFLDKLLTAPSLEKLDVQTDIDTVHRRASSYLHAVMARAHLPRLRRLKLLADGFEENAMIDFIRRHKITLQRVSFWIYWLDPGEADEREAPYLQAVPGVDIEFYSPDGRVS